MALGTDVILVSSGHSQLEFIRWRAQGWVKVDIRWTTMGGHGRGHSTCKDKEGDGEWPDWRMRCPQAVCFARNKRWLRTRRLDRSREVQDGRGVRWG